MVCKHSLATRYTTGTVTAPSRSLTFSPFIPGSPGVPGNPWGPIMPCKGGHRGWARCRGGHPLQHPSAPPTYGFAVLAGVTLGMAKGRGQRGVQGKKGEQPHRCPQERGCRSWGLNSQARHPCRGALPSPAAPGGRRGRGGR